MTLSVGKYTYSQMDGSGQVTSHQVNTYFAADGAEFGAILPLRAAYLTGLQGITNGAKTLDALYGQYIVTPQTPPSAEAQAELKFFVRYHDAVTEENMSVTIGCPDLSIVSFIPQTSYVDLTTTEMATWKTAFEAFVTGGDGNESPTVVDTVQIVGRKRKLQGN